MFFLYSSKLTNNKMGVRRSLILAINGVRIINFKTMTAWRKKFFNYSRTLNKPVGFTQGDCFNSYHFFNFTLHVEKRRNKQSLRKLWHFAG